MTTLERVRAEIEQDFIDIGMDGTYEWNIIQEAFDKYNPQEEEWYKAIVEAFEPCDDVVSRQAVLDVIYGQHIGGKEAVEHGLRNTYAGDLREIADEIIALPSVRPQEQAGHWIEDDMTYCGVDLTNYKCDKCGEMGGSWRKGLKHDKLPKYCMNCGARMVEPQESEEV